MIFNTWTFAVFALLTLAIYWSIVPQRLKPFYLIAVGCIFYAFSVPAYLLLVVTLGAITFGVGHGMLRCRNNLGAKKAWLIFGVAVITAVLFTFKYTKFFASTVNQVAQHHVIPIPNLIVPLAISFFTFEFLHVLVDVYLNKIEGLDATEFAVFTLFFPTLVAGPIKRYQTFAPQIRSIVLPANEVITLNIYRVMLGLAKKFILADSMSILAQPLLTPHQDPYGRIDYVVAVFAYTAKIYFDFTGYSDIAIGISGLLGIQIPENFDRPYWSENISIFWRRWHMSLSSWIRDYIFIPLGGSRRRPMITMINLLFAMALAGLWHGAAWTFVAWGLWHGFGLAVHRLWVLHVAPRLEAVLSAMPRLTKGLSIGMTFIFVSLGWVLFAATSFSNASDVLRLTVVQNQ